MNTVERRLGYSETFFCIPAIQSLDYNNTAMMIELEGSIDPELFKQALYALYSKHPALRAAYYKSLNPNCYHFRYDLAFDDIPIQIQDAHPLHLETGLSNLEKVIATEYQENKPLWRACLLRSMDNKSPHYLIFGFHHAIIDGISQLTIAQDFVSFYQAAAQGRPSKPQSLPISRPLSEMLSPTISLEDYMEKYKKAYQLYKPITELSFEKNVPLSHTKTRILLCDLDKGTLDKMRVFSKQHNLKITALISACLLMAMHDTTGHKETFLQVAVNLRKYTKPKIPNEIVGCFINGIRVVIKNMDQYQSVVTLARDYQRQYDHNFQLLYIPPRTFPFQSVNQAFHQLLSKPREAFSLGPGISNWGKVNFKQPADGFKVISIHRATGRQLGDAPFYLHIASINDQVYGAFNFAEPLLSEKTMKAIIQAFRKILLSL